MTEPLFLKFLLTIALLSGALMCFFGYRLFRVVLTIFGALFGGFLGALAGSYFSGGHQIAVIVCGIIGALVGGIALTALYILGVFLVGAAFGMMIGSAAAVNYGMGIQLIAGSIAGILCGLAALWAQKLIITVATALQGAGLLIVGGLMLWKGLRPDELDVYLRSLPQKELMMIGGVLLVLACIGAVVQFSGKEAPSPAPDQPRPSTPRGHRRPWRKSKPE